MSNSDFGMVNEVRRSRYKVAVDVDEGRGRRKNNLVEVRQHKREESLWMKRKEGLQNNVFEREKGFENGASSLSSSGFLYEVQSPPPLSL
ncbi:hypothetical protein LIER_14401 [Lithospermum erythrorhizon]|uniref:IBB domain-containing protein n=1 Tax=Lithospermum erythrorhizon TaxID=34254 RepID=A0AAV3PZ01_LITER